MPSNKGLPFPLDVRELAFGCFTCDNSPERFEQMSLPHTAWRAGRESRLPKEPSSTLDAIMRAASEHFARYGFHGVKISRLCESAGVANGTFYIYFKSKKQLYEALLKQVLDEFMLALRSREDDSAPPAELDRGDVELIVDFCSRHRWFSLAVFNERALKLNSTTTVLDKLIDQRANGIAAGQKRGVFRKDMDPRLAAQAEVAVTTELVNSWLSGKTGKSRKEVVEALWQFRLRLCYEPVHWMRTPARAKATPSRSRAPV
jgi:AcrR family transcriptional regulator